MNWKLREKILSSFATFVTSSNTEWYAKNAKTFFEGVADYADTLGKDLYTTAESFLGSLYSAGQAWDGMTGNSFQKFNKSMTGYLGGDGVASAKTKVSDYQIEDANHQVFMTESCEKNVGNHFEKFAADVKAAIDDCASVLNQGELIGGGQSEAYVNMIKAIGTKYEAAMADQKGELTTALSESRAKYEEQAANVANAKLEDQ